RARFQGQAQAKPEAAAQYSPPHRLARLPVSSEARRSNQTGFLNHCMETLSAYQRMQLAPHKSAFRGRASDFLKLENQLIRVTTVGMALPPTREQVGERIAELQSSQFVQPQAPASIVSQRAIDFAMIGILKANFSGLSLGGLQESRILGLLAPPDGLAAQTRLFLGHDRLHSRQGDRWRHALSVPLAHDPPVLQIHRPDVAGLSQSFSE